jgi:hypothetical protein
LNDRLQQIISLQFKQMKENGHAWWLSFMVHALLNASLSQSEITRLKHVNKQPFNGNPSDCLSKEEISYCAGGYINGRNSANLELLIVKTSSIYLYVKLKISMLFYFISSLRI